MLWGEDISQKRGLMKKGEKDSTEYRLNVNSFPSSHLFRGQKIGNVPIKTRSLSAFPWFLAPALCWPLCSCKEAASLKHHRKKTVVPQTMKSPAHRHLQNRQATMLAEFSTCCYSSRKNVIPAALQRFISKSHQLPKRTLTLRCPFSGAEPPGTNP